MTIACFEDAAALDRAGLQALLEHGRPEQRVWAIWALALRSRGDVTGLAAATRGDRMPVCGGRWR